MISPRWHQIKIGPILRREKDWRWYTGLFQRVPGDVVGITARILKWRTTPITEPRTFEEYPKEGSGPVRIQFSGLADYFARLNEHHGFIRDQLLAATHSRWARWANDTPAAPIAMHIRRGDFKFGSPITPDEWFLNSLRLIRKRVGRELSAIVFSDGTDQELAPILAEPGVRRMATGSALGDIWALSRVRLILGSTNSTFSFWSILLGQVAAVFPNRATIDDHGLANVRGRYLGAFDPMHPADEALARIVDDLRD